jgi:hypothetical protein
MVEALDPTVFLARIATANVKRDRRMVLMRGDEMLVRLKVLEAQDGGVAIAMISAVTTLPSAQAVTPVGPSQPGKAYRAATARPDRSIAATLS